MIADEREFTMPNVGLVRLRDSETGKMVVLDTFSRSNRRAYEELTRRQAAERDELVSFAAARPHPHFHGRRFCRAPQAILSPAGDASMSRQTLIRTLATITACLPLVALAASPANTDSLTSVVSDGPVKLRVDVDKATAHVAEPIQVTLEVAAPRGTRVELPTPSGSWGEFDVRGSKKTKEVPAADNAANRSWVLNVTLDTIKTGDITIPPLDVRYAADAKSTTFNTLSTKPISIHITSVLENRADPTKFRDIKGTVDAAVPELRSYAWLGWTAAGVGTVAALALLTLLVIKRKRGPTPAVWALSSIADLERLPVKDGTDAEAVFNETVDVVREFFELQFGVPTLTRTTREFLTEAANEPILNATARQRLTSLVSIADEIKFARRTVGEEQVRQACEHATAFVTECERCCQVTEKEAA